MRAFTRQAQQRRSALLGYLFGWRSWIVLAPVLLLLVFLSGLGLRTPWARPLARALARCALRLAGLPVKVHGLNHLPAGPHVLLVNHGSFLDPIVLIALLPARPGYAFVTRQQTRSQAVLWPLLHSLGTVILARPSGSYSANVEMLKKRLASGESLVVFPEGRFRREQGLQAFHSGIFVAASDTGVPVVPAGLRAVRTCLPLGNWLPKRCAITLLIGKPMLPSRFQARSAETLRLAARQVMLKLCADGDASL